MNVVFLSPHFPPHYHLFCSALRARGARVLGVGDSPREDLSSKSRASLDDYVYVREMLDNDAMARALGYLTWRHGRIDLIDSLNEHWLAVEDQLRTDFNVEGLRPADLLRGRTKFGMAEVFREAGIKAPPTLLIREGREVRAFAARHGYPLMFKPDVGVGAEMAFQVNDAAALERALERSLAGFVVQPFIQGTITTFDGLVDRDGQILFEHSFIYSNGMLEFLRDQLDVCFYTRRHMPSALVELGRAVVSAFGVRGRFFHCELFELADGSFIPLEINLRPPGGYSIDCMNYACDIDLYQLWADVVTNGDTSSFHYEHRYHVAHLGRRPVPYLYPHSELVKLLGSALVSLPEVPGFFGRTMGDPLYLLRHEDEGELKRLIQLVFARP